MCFLKSRQSKVLIAKKGIVVYKVGQFADNIFFRPYYHGDFKYSTNQIVSETVNFTKLIEYGLHSYINCMIQPYGSDYIDLYTSAGLLHTISASDPLFLGKFIIPRGGAYCMNIYNEVVSDRLIYTGKYIKLESGKRYNTRKLWKEK